MTQTWYLSCDLHYFIIAIFLIILSKSRKKIAFAIFIMLNIVAVVAPFLITIIYTRPALLHFYPEFLVSPKTHPDFALSYVKSHTRASSYLVGMIGGYLYYRLKDSTKQLPKVINLYLSSMFVLNNNWNYLKLHLQSPKHELFIVQ